MSLTAIVPARGGSKGIPRKNIRDFCGKPLIQWTIEAALRSSSIKRVIVSTEDTEIAEVAKLCGADVPFLRPAALASDTTPAIDPVLHLLEKLSTISEVLLLQPTSPLRSVDDIEGIIAMRRQYGAESAVSLSPCGKHPAYMYNISTRMTLDSFSGSEKPTQRQALSSAYELNGALYFASREFLIREQDFMNKDTVGYVMPRERSVDIDTQLDWEWGEFLMQGQK